MTCDLYCTRRYKSKSCKNPTCPYTFIGDVFRLPCSYRRPARRDDSLYEYSFDVVPCQITSEYSRLMDRFRNGEWNSRYQHVVKYSAVFELEMFKERALTSFITKSVLIRKYLYDPNELIYFHLLKKMDLKNEGILYVKRDAPYT